MRAAWMIHGIGFLIILVALFYLLSRQASAPTVVQPDPDGSAAITSSSSLLQSMEHTAMMVRSPAFVHEETIPSKYTCDGENMSPPLAIDDAPEGTVSLVLIVEDPDVPLSIREDGLWDHWVVFNIPPDTTRIGEGEAPKGVRGMTTSGKLTYGGPCPPNGEHRYFFKVYALDTMLDLPEGATKKEVLQAMEGHVLESTTLMGRYTRV